MGKEPKFELCFFTVWYCISSNLKGNVKMNARKSLYPVEKIFLNRWSPRALTPKPLDQKTLMTLFEAARWAPSSYNAQQWRFIYANRETPEWQTLFNLMGEFNQSWAKNASTLVVIISRKNFEYNNKPSITHSFDTGSAWMSLALQASMLGLVAHGMEGFDYEKARKDLKVPDDYSVEAMCAIGIPGNVKDLPKDLQEREFPSNRKPLKEIVFEGKFKY